MVFCNTPSFGSFDADLFYLLVFLSGCLVCSQFDPEFIMAVQQNKKSPSKRGMHRSHNALNTPGIAVEPTTGEIHLRHHISPTGFYRGRKVLKTKSEA